MWVPRLRERWEEGLGVAKRAGTEEGLRRRCNLRGGEGLGKWAVDEERGEI